MSPDCRVAPAATGTSSTQTQGWYGDRGGQAERRRAAGDSVEEAERLIREAVALHVQSLRAPGEPVPPPSAVAATVVTVPAA
jgi:hypothetical protein